MIKNIYNYFFENLNIKIDKKLWNGNEKRISTWSINKNPKFIAIIGNDNKDMISTFSQYLSIGGESFNILSSKYIKTTSGLYTTDNYKDKYDLNDLATFLWICNKDKPDYIIIECSIESLIDNVFFMLPFDYKIINDFDYIPNVNHSEEMQLKAGKLFVERYECPTLINIDSDNAIKISENINKDHLSLFSLGPNYIDEKYLTKLEEIKNQLNKDNILIYPTFKLGEISKSYFICKLNEIETINWIVKLSLSLGINIAINTIAAILFIDLFNITLMKDFLRYKIYIKGLGDDFDREQNKEVIEKYIKSAKYKEVVKYCKNYLEYTPLEDVIVKNIKKVSKKEENKNDN